MKKTIILLILLVAVVFVVRLTIAFNTYVISSDGPFYLSVAQSFAAGDYKSAMQKQFFHPLYPFLIAIASNFVSDWEWAGLLLSILFSSLGVIPIYLIGKRYFPYPVVIISCLFYAFHPQASRLSASILTTGVFIGILLFALWVTIIAMETYRYKYFFISGLLSFIMYLVRPDGIIFLLLSLIGILVNIHKSAGKNKTVFKKSISILILIIPWIVLMPPYLYSVYSVARKVDISGKASLREMAGFTPSKMNGLENDDSTSEESDSITPAESYKKAPVRRHLNGAYLLVVSFIKGAHPLLFLLLLIGSISYSKKQDRLLGKSFFIWFAFIVFIIVFFRYAVVYERISKRYTVPIFIMVILWAGNGLYFITEAILGSLKKTLKYKNIVYYILSGITIISISFLTFQPVGKSKMIEKVTGELLKNYHSINRTTDKKPVIITITPRIAYYAGGDAVVPVDLNKDYHKLSAIILKDRIDYLVLDGRIIKRFPQLESEIIKCNGNNLSVELISPYFETAGGTNTDFYKVYKFSIISQNK